MRRVVPMWLLVVTLLGSTAASARPPGPPRPPLAGYVPSACVDCECGLVSSDDRSFQPPPFLAPLLDRAATLSPTAAAIYRTARCPDLYIAFQRRDPLERYRAEARVHGVDRASGRIVGTVLYDARLESKVRAGSITARDLALIFHEIFHLEEVRALSRQWGVGDIHALCKRMVHEGLGRDNGSGLIETAEAVAVTARIEDELRAAGATLQSQSSPANAVLARAEPGSS